MSATTRIQLRRTKGWRKPAGAVVVDRPSKWGNPYRVSEKVTAEEAVRLFRIWAEERRQQIREQLHGRDLACWCPLDQPCHADVLLEIANEASEAP